MFETEYSHMIIFRMINKNSKKTQLGLKPEINDGDQRWALFHFPTQKRI